jgi:hypothetical protein
MGQKLKAIFDSMKDEQGMQGQMRLAMKAGLSAASAATEADDPDKVAKCKAAYKEIAGKDAPVA